MKGIKLADGPTLKSETKKNLFKANKVPSFFHPFLRGVGGPFSSGKGAGELTLVAVALGVRGHETTVARGAGTEAAGRGWREEEREWASEMMHLFLFGTQGSFVRTSWASLCACAPENEGGEAGRGSGA